jgi:predicted tellurium resistance membrane protein TerC
MAKQQQSITSLPRSPQDDRRSRMIQYSVAMTIRTVCLVLCLIVPDWWRLLPAIGAIVLPYIAVVLANASIAGPAAPGPDSR